jgi:hypothetical protein
MALPPDHPVTVSCAALAHRLNVTRLRLAQCTSLAELAEHLEAVIGDACRSLTLLEAHPDPDAVVVVDDLGPDADLTARWG